MLTYHPRLQLEKQHPITYTLQGSLPANQHRDVIATDPMSSSVILPIYPLDHYLPENLPADVLVNTRNGPRAVLFLEAKDLGAGEGLRPARKRRSSIGRSHFG